MKTAIEYSKISLSISILLYLLASFVRWDLTWVFEINNWSIAERGGFLIGYLVKEGFTALIYNTSKL